MITKNDIKNKYYFDNEDGDADNYKIMMTTRMTTRSKDYYDATDEEEDYHTR